MDIKWDTRTLDFVGGDVVKLQQEITNLYREEFDSNWMNRVWLAIRDWRRKPKNRGKHYQYEEDHICGWFTREANKEREKLDSSLSNTRAEAALFESQRDDTTTSIAACEKEHGPHKDAELKDGSKTRYCKHGCGYYVAKGKQ